MKHSISRHVNNDESMRIVELEHKQCIPIENQLRTSLHTVFNTRTHNSLSDLSVNQIVFGVDLKSV